MFLRLPLVLRKYTIYGSSMSPTLYPGDTILASSLPYLLSKPKVHDIVICTDPRDSRVLIKRITKTRKNTYFVSGDNPAHSTDSRVFGFIERKDIMGKVIYRISKS